MTPQPWPRPWGPREIPVPYATAWTGETPVTASALTIRPDGTGLAYRDETTADRDRHGMLWARLRHAPGTGRPDFRALHTHRQRRTQLRKLCQVCGGPASRTDEGWLFLIPRPGPADGEPQANWPEGMLSTKPPVCLPCADLAVRHCPHLAEPLLVRCRNPETWGVFGGFYVPAAAGGLAASGPDTVVPYGHPAAPWFLASQLVIRLTACTRTAVHRPVNLPRTA
jgi:hypothetical protein